MELVQSFRDPERVMALARQACELSVALEEQWRRPVQVMEVCGGHTHAIYRHGLQQLVGDAVEFLHGPGCPVCVLPKFQIDQCIEFARQPDVVVATYGDVMRVPGTRQSFQQAKAEGADIRMVYSALDALALAQQYPERNVIFFAIGFETTMPATALTLQQAKRAQLRNFFVYCHHIRVIPALGALLQDQDTLIDGFIGPGHVSAIIGTEPYGFIASDFHKPLVISGFEPVDILQSLVMVLQQLTQGESLVQVQYSRVVTPQGNLRAQAAMADVFAVEASTEWRGLGALPDSGVTLNSAYEAFDAARRFAPAALCETSPDVGACAAVLKGRLKPHQCEFFGNRCTPRHPLGALMVSSEGACSACYQHA